jgi:hypothetical protein
MSVSDVADRLRQPEYTGENRCLPCTVVNVLIAAVLAALLSVVLTPVVGLIGFAVGLGLIYLRGYLVPGTPALTKEYFPPWLLRLFGKEPIEAIDTATRSQTGAATGPERGAGSAVSAANGETETSDTGDSGDDSVAADPFVASGIVESVSGELTSAFREAWIERIATVENDGVEPADVAAMYGASEARETGDESFVLDGNKSVRWGSRAALVADVAAADLLAERLDAWADYDRDRRQSVLLGLRLELDRCPACDGDVSYTQERVDPCCQKPHLVADAVCDACGAPIADAAVVDDGETERVSERLLTA